MGRGEGVGVGWEIEGHGAILIRTGEAREMSTEEAREMSTVERRERT